VDLAAALLLSLLGGYCFAYVWRAIAFTTKQADGLERRRAVQPGLSVDWSSQFELIIRADEIVTAAPVSVDIYGEFNPGWRQRIAQHNCDAPGESGCEDFTSTDPPSYVLSSIGTNRKFSGPT
jgi:hypothetical protein